METKNLQLAFYKLITLILVLGVVNLQAADFTVQAESFDRDGGGYNDGNGGGVGKDATQINYVNAGDWVEYDINVTTAGMYKLTYTIATPSADAAITYLFDGYTISADAVSATGSWATYTTLDASVQVSLTAGAHVLRLEASGTNPWQWNLDKIDFTKTGDIVNVDVAGIEISPVEIYLNQSQYFNMKSVITPSNATDKTINWSSADTDIATVTPTGKITGVSKGSVKVYAQTNNGGFKDSVTVNVFDNTDVITIEAENFTATGGVAYTADLGVKVNAGTGINWVNNTDWAEYSVTIPSDGRYQITYYISTPSDNAEITSYLNGNEISVDLVPENGAWDNYYPLVAAKEALIPAGTHTFKIEASGTNAWQWNMESIELIKISSDLTFPVTLVELDIDSYTMLSGDELQLNETVSPAYATNKNVTWNTDNPSVATVVDGLVTAGTKGTANITVTTEDGSLTATAQIVVAGAKVTVSPASVSIEKGQTTNLSATILPNSNADTVLWTSDNTNIATVDTFGVVTAVAEGTVKIIATLKNEQVTSECMVTVTHIKAKFSIALDNEMKYYGTYPSGGTLTVTTNFNAGEGETISTALKGVTYFLRLVNTNQQWAIVKEVKVEDQSAVGKQSGTSVANIPLAGLTPSSELPAGHGYLLFIRVMNTNLDLKEISIYPVTIGPAVSSPDELSSKIFAYPNPATDNVYISGLENESCNVSVISLNGQLLSSKLFDTGEEKIMQIDYLPSGYYLLNIKNDRLMKTIKICKP